MSDAPTTVIEDVAPEPARRHLTILLGVVAGLVLVAVGWFLVLQPLLAGDGSTTEDASVAAPAPPADDAQAPPPEVEDEILPAMTYEVFLSRDPFEPVVPEPEPQVVVAAEGDTSAADDGAAPAEGGTDAGEDGDGATSPDDPDAGPPDADGTGADEVPASSAGCQGRDEVDCDGRIVTLIDVTRDADGTRIAVLQVDTTVHEVARGETFAGVFRLTGIEKGCVDVLYGDDGFKLCEGDRVLK